MVMYGRHVKFFEGSALRAGSHLTLGKLKPVPN
jgi:hypothetical protein